MFDRVLNTPLKPAENYPFVSFLKYFHFALPKIRVTNVDSFSWEAYLEHD